MTPEHNIATRAMLASLSISMWGARKHDKKVSKEVADSHQTTETAGRYTKNLLPDEGIEVFKAIGSRAGIGRQIFYAQTLPWLDNGSRILTAANFVHCGNLMGAEERAFNATLPPFFDQYRFLKARAKATRGTLFCEEDWPELEDLKERFEFKLRFFPIPVADDFRADISDADVAAIKAQVSQDTKSNVMKAMEEPYKRLFDGVAHMAARLANTKTCPCRACKGKTFLTDQFGDSLVDNLVDMCDVLPRLNLTGDQYLESYIAQVKLSLTEFKPDLIRNSDQVRKTLAERAADIAADMKGWMAVA